MLILFVTCAWSSFLRNTTFEIFRDSEDFFTKFESIFKSFQSTAVFPSFQDVKKCFQDVMRMQKEEKTKDVAVSEPVLSSASEPKVQTNREKGVLERRFLIPTESKSSKADNPKRKEDIKHPQQNFDVGEGLGTSVMRDPERVDLISPSPKKDRAQGAQQDSEVERGTDEPMEKPSLTPAADNNTADPGRGERGNEMDMQKEVRVLDEVRVVPEPVTDADLITPDPEPKQNNSGKHTEKEVDAEGELDEVRVISKPIPCINLISPDPEPMEENELRTNALKEVEEELDKVIVVSEPEQDDDFGNPISSQNNALEDCTGPSVSKSKSVGTPDAKLKGNLRPNTKTSEVGANIVRRSTRLQLKTFTKSPGLSKEILPKRSARMQGKRRILNEEMGFIQSPQPSEYILPKRSSRTKERRGNENQDMPPRKKRCIRGTSVPACAAARLEEATELIESILLCNVVKSSGSLLQNLPDSISQNEKVFFLSSAESLMFKNEIFGSLLDKGYNVTHIVLFGSGGCVEMPSAIGISSLPLARQVLFMPENCSSPFTISANVQYQIGHFHLTSSSENYIPLLCLRETQLDGYFEDIVGKLRISFGISDWLEDKTSVVKAFLAAKARLSYIRATEISYHPVRGSTITILPCAT